MKTDLGRISEGTPVNGKTISYDIIQKIQPTSKVFLFTLLRLIQKRLKVREKLFSQIDQAIKI